MAVIATLPSKNREIPMSEAHPDADLVKVTRTTTTYEPAETKAPPAAVRSRKRTIFWLVGACVAVAVIAGAFYYASTQNTPVSAQQSAVAADQQRAQTLGQQATASQQSADQAAQQAQSLATAAAKDRDAADRASTNAVNSRDAAATAK